MSKIGRILPVLLFLAVLVSSLVLVFSYNGLVSSEAKVDGSWAQIEVQYQRRADLIPQIVDATNTFIQFEQDLLTEIARARSAWTSSLEGTQEEQIDASEDLNQAYSRLLAVVIVEDYPQIQSDQVVLSLIDELEGTENRIAVARLLYNEAVLEYNVKVRAFPSNVVAGLFGFQQRPFFQSTT